MAEIVLDGVTKRYPDGALAVDHIDLDIADGEFVILVGPSGCGKSTTLNMIAGLEDISEGELRIGGKLVNNVAPTVNAGPDQTINEGSLVTLYGSATDPGVNDHLLYHWTVVSSNGQFVSDGIAPTFNFTPVDTGTYTVTLTLRDTDTGTVVVTRNIPITLIIS